MIDTTLDQNDVLKNTTTTTDAESTNYVEDSMQMPLRESEMPETVVPVMRGCGKLNVYNWLEDLPKNPKATDIVEVRFKNTRKGFYKNVNDLNLEKGDIVAVEASPGHDIGVVSLTGDLVLRQMKRLNFNESESELKKIYRKAKPVDIEKWYTALELEESVMLQAREIAWDLKLAMKIGDVEFQGDRTKAIFYYIADERVDFRQLIKVLAERFRIRVEMRQIGARQEAGRIGGIGSCGRSLCCSTWITNFISVTTNAARYQDLSLNPQKLAGQCGKLKCCLNYEVDCYIDAQKDFPQINAPIKTDKGLVYHIKTDIYRKIMWFSYEQESTVNAIPISVEKVFEILELSKKGVVVKDFTGFKEDNNEPEEKLDYMNVVGEESLDRFDDRMRNNKRKKPRSKQEWENNKRQGNQNYQQKNNTENSNQQHSNQQQRNNERSPKNHTHNANRQNNQNKGNENNQNVNKGNENNQNKGNENNQNANKGNENNQNIL